MLFPNETKDLGSTKKKLGNKTRERDVSLKNYNFSKKISQKKKENK